MAISKGLGQFRARMLTLAAAVPGDVERIMRKVALIMDQRVVLLTPVDTGRARGNWRVTTGQPFEGQVEGPFGPKRKTPLQQAPPISVGGQEPIQQGSRVIAQYKLSKGAIFLTNNVEYIGFLNDGSSAQAPKNFIALAVDAGVQALKKEKINLPR